MPIIVSGIITRAKNGDVDWEKSYDSFATAIALARKYFPNKTSFGSSLKAPLLSAQIPDMARKVAIEFIKEKHRVELNSDILDVICTHWTSTPLIPGRSSFHEMIATGADLIIHLYNAHSGNAGKEKSY